jgi:hypothetical protein
MPILETFPLAPTRVRRDQALLVEDPARTVQRHLAGIRPVPVLARLPLRAATKVLALERRLLRHLIPIVLTRGRGQFQGRRDPSRRLVLNQQDPIRRLVLIRRDPSRRDVSLRPVLIRRDPSRRLVLIQQDPIRRLVLIRRDPSRRDVRLRPVLTLQDPSRPPILGHPGTKTMIRGQTCPDPMTGGCPPAMLLQTMMTPGQMRQASPHPWRAAGHLLAT